MGIMGLFLIMGRSRDCDEGYVLDPDVNFGPRGPKAPIQKAEGLG